MKYDVTITGGGIAGLALAVDLGLRGYSSLVLEKGTYPRHKVCGEYISMESTSYLSRILPELNEMDLPRISKFRLTAPGSTYFETQLPLGGIGISRYTLENKLAERAESLGVKVLTNTKVNGIEYSDNSNAFSVKSDAGEYESSVTCIAAGKRSNLDNSKTSDPRYIAVKYHITIDRDPELIEIHSFPGGYCGISNIEENKSCMCYIVSTTKLRAARYSIQEVENLFLRKNKSISRIIDRAEHHYEKPLTISGIEFKVKNSSRNNMLFLGDAAGSIAPITGNGMSMGLRSAAYLGDQIPRFLDGEITRLSLNNNYNRFWKNEFASRISLSRQLQRLSENPALASISIRLFNSFPSFANKLIAKTNGNSF